MPPNLQLQLRESEMNRLAMRVQEDFNGALLDHKRRMERFRRYYQKFRNRVDPPPLGEENESNFSVPMLQWNVYAKWAQSVGAMFGDDAEIVATAVGPSDQKIVRKVGRYMTWRVFESMNALVPFSLYQFRNILFGRAIAYRPWVRDIYKVRDRPGGATREEVWYDGPGFFPQWPDDILVPAEDVDSIQDFSFVIRKYRVTPQQLLDGEREGRYFGIKENLQSIVSYAMQRRERDYRSDDIKLEKDESEGITYEGSRAVRDSLIVHEWHGHWRLPKGKRDARVDNLDWRAQDQSDLVVRFLPDMVKVIGVQDLMDLYPRMKARRPFCETSLVKDGSYWSPGFGELLESIEDEASANHNLFTTAGELSVGPVLFFKPGSGYDADRFKYEPGMAYPSEDPAGINALQMKADLQFCLLKDQALGAMAEKVTGNSELNMGRVSDRPNQPRTASGQMALIAQGNVRASLDTTFMREDLRLNVGELWQLDSEFSPESVFFRVTEEDANGLFDTGKGGAHMTAKERGGRYDFDIKFATTVWSREAAKERQLQLFQLDMMNPLIAQNPVAVWNETDKLHRAFGDDNFAETVPKPPNADVSKNPKEEWAEMQQGEDVEPNPMDNDDLHIVDHARRLEQAQEDKPEDRDKDAEMRMKRHILQHQQQKHKKMLMQAMAQKMVETMQQLQAQGGGGGMPMPMPGMDQQAPDQAPGGGAPPLVPPGAAAPGAGGLPGAGGVQ
jgi:hypothetical protein